MAQIRKVKNKKGEAFKVVIRIKGYKPIYKTFDKKTEAKSWAEDIEYQIKKGKYKPTKDEIVKPIVTVSDLITEFQE